MKPRRRQTLHPAAVLIAVLFLFVEIFDFGDVLQRVFAGWVVLPVAIILLLSVGIAATISLFVGGRLQR